MAKRTLGMAAAIGFAACLAMPAAAQVAAESAQILSATGQGTGAASRSLGSSISGSLNNASAQIGATLNGGRGAHAGRQGGGQGEGYAISGDADSLEGTSAPTYDMGNGASIRVSGGLRQRAKPACTAECPVAADQAPTAP